MPQYKVVNLEAGSGTASKSRKKQSTPPTRSPLQANKATSQAPGESKGAIKSSNGRSTRTLGPNAPNRADAKGKSSPKLPNSAKSTSDTVGVSASKLLQHKPTGSGGTNTNNTKKQPPTSISTTSSQHNSQKPNRSARKENSTKMEESKQPTPPALNRSQKSNKRLGALSSTRVTKSFRSDSCARIISLTNNTPGGNGSRHKDAAFSDKSAGQDRSTGSSSEGEMPINFGDSNVRSLSKMQRSGSIGSNAGSRSWKRSGHSGHSLTTASSFRVSADNLDEFDDDPPLHIQILRSIRILPPSPNERRERRNIRIFIWLALFCDFIAAMVSITTYDGVTTCCGEPIFSIALVDVNWSKAIRISTYIYLVIIFAEIVPVLRQGIPFNLLNPMVGFAITFAMFFDDRIAEAVTMWIIEASAVLLEFAVYRIQSKLYNERMTRLDELTQGLKEVGMEEPRDCERNVAGDSNGKSSSLDGSAHELKKTRMLRERRVLRQEQQAERLTLRYHFFGVVVNFSLVCISLILIIVIAASGGLCIVDGERPVVFDMNQLGKCSACQGHIHNGVCELCTRDEGPMCYYQYI